MLLSFGQRTIFSFVNKVFTGNNTLVTSVAILIIPAQSNLSFHPVLLSFTKCVCEHIEGAMRHMFVHG